MSLGEGAVLARDAETRYNTPEDEPISGNQEQRTVEPGELEELKC